MVSLTAEEVSCERPAVALHDERADEIVIFFTPDSAGKKVRPAESVVLRRIFETGVGAAVNDVGAGPQADSPVDRTLSARQLVAAPLDVSGSRVGLVAAVNSTLGGFTHDDVRRLTMVADWAALAIENGRLKSAMARQQQELETLSEADKTKSDFVSVLAHELKGPMTAVKGFAEVLQDRWEGLPQATVMRTLRIMSKEIERLSRLVGDLLDLSQIEDGTLGYEMRPLSLGDLIDDIVTGHHP